MSSLIIYNVFRYCKTKNILQISHPTGWFVQGEYFDYFLAICMLKFFIEKLGQFEFAKSCIEFPEYSVNYNYLL